MGSIPLCFSASESEASTSFSAPRPVPEQEPDLVASAPGCLERSAPLEGCPVLQVELVPKWEELPVKGPGSDWGSTSPFRIRIPDQARLASRLFSWAWPCREGGMDA